MKINYNWCKAVQEKDLNRIINKTFAQQGFSHKMQDPPKAVAMTFGKNPFDGFAIVDGMPVYWEAKLSRGYYALPFSSIREHQIESLLAIDDSPHTFPVVMWGVYEPRQVKQIYTFWIGYLKALLEQGKKSITKKELLLLRDQGRYVEVKGEYFDIAAFWSSIIYG